MPRNFAAHPDRKAVGPSLGMLALGCGRTGAVAARRNFTFLTTAKTVPLFGEPGATLEGGETTACRWR
jgi:hypothetical protein